MSTAALFSTGSETPLISWIELLVPPTREASNDRYRCIRTKADLGVSIEDHGLYRIVTAERAIAEAFRYATKMGLETAIKAARTAIRDKLTTTAKVLKVARALACENHMMKHWEAIIVE